MFAFFCGNLCFFLCKLAPTGVFSNRLYRENWFAELDK